jgi:threonine dehydratase
MAQGVAWLAREQGLPCTVIAPESAPEVKLAAIEALGATVVRVGFEAWWQAFEERAYPGVEGTFVHAFDDLRVMAGNATIAAEILEDLPGVDAVITPWGGGGLTCGVAAALEWLKPSCRVFASEVEGAAPLAASLAAGKPTRIDYQPSFVDGIGSPAVFPRMLRRARALGVGSLVASVEEVARAVLLLARRNHVIAEGAGACPVAAAAKLPAAFQRVACVVSGGNLDVRELAGLLAMAGRPQAGDRCQPGQ